LPCVKADRMMYKVQDHAPSLIQRDQTGVIIAHGSVSIHRAFCRAAATSS